MNRLNKNEAAIFFLKRSLLPEDIHLELISSSLQRVLCRVAAVKSSFRTYSIFTAAGIVPRGGRKTSPRISSWCTLYIFWSIWDIRLILDQFENRFLVLGGGGGGEQCCTITLLHMNKLS